MLTGVSIQEFRQWFLEETVGSSRDGDVFIGAWHSLEQGDLGESDLIVKFRRPQGVRQLFMIENKIDAAFQPGQADRYQARGKNYQCSGECDEYFTVLIAPQYYGGTEGFDHAVSYESLRLWFDDQAALGERGRYKAEILRLAIEKCRRGYQPVRHEATADFWRRYWELARQEAPLLKMPEPHGNVPINSSFIYFKPDGIPEGCRLVHKAARGFVDLQFSDRGTKLEEFRAQYGTRLEEGMSIVRCNRSAAVRIIVPVIDLQAPFDTQKDKVLASLDAAQRMLRWSMGGQ